jgi:hypothetical protein
MDLFFIDRRSAQFSSFAFCRQLIECFNIAVWMGAKTILPKARLFCWEIMPPFCCFRASPRDFSTLFYTAAPKTPHLFGFSFWRP